MEYERFFTESDRYVFDQSLGQSGFAQVDTWQDASYFGIWANPKTLIIFSYHEGDCCKTMCGDREEFVNEINRIKEYNTAQGGERGFLGIDAGISPIMIQRWNDIGLGHLLH